MGNEIFILTVEAMAVYLLVLWAHSLRRRFGPAHFYALMGGLTAIMSWVTDLGVSVEIAGITFMVGSTVFYTSLLLGTFVVYVFDGPYATRIAISTVVGVSAITPAIAALLRLQIELVGNGAVSNIPLPSLRINAASVATTLVDMVFLAMAWEFLGKRNLHFRLWIRAFATLLAVMWLDVILFTTGAFAGTPGYLGIMKGTLVSRFVISVFAFPFLYVYLRWQRKKAGGELENRPVLAILGEVADIEAELSDARMEIEKRKKAEEERDKVIQELRKALSEVKTLRGFLPICSSCKSIRDDQGFWNKIEFYLKEHSDAEFSHGICPKCARELYPDLDIYDEK